MARPERVVHAQGSLTDLLAGVDPAGEWCLRWADGRHSWRHRREGGFDESRYSVEPIDEAVAKAYVLRHHYAHSYPAAVRRFGLFVDDDSADPLVGVAVFSVPVSAAVLTRVFPHAEPVVETLELGRFVLEGGVQAHSGTAAGRAPANAESWFLARCFAQLAASGIRGIVSFSDPVPRRIGDAIVMPGHVGIAYQASNAIYTGRAAPATLTVLPDNTVLHARAKQKVRAQERGHEAIERRLIALGAPAQRAGERPAIWLARALEVVGARSVRHRGVHRYAFVLGANRRARAAVHIGLPSIRYPKRPDDLVG